MTFFAGVSKNMGHERSDEPWADLLASKLSDWQPFKIFLGRQWKIAKTAFSAKKPFSSIFLNAKIFPG